MAICQLPSTVQRLVGRPAGLDPTAPHSLISPPAVASPGLEACRQSAASHLSPIAPSVPPASAWIDRGLQTRPEGKAARLEVGG